MDEEIDFQPAEDDEEEIDFQPADEEPSPGMEVSPNRMSALRAGVQASAPVIMPFIDEMTAGIGTGIAQFAPETMGVKKGTGLSAIPDDYRKIKDRINKDDERAFKERPRVAYPAAAAGMIGAAVTGRGVGALNPKTIKGAMGLGAAYGYGSSDKGTLDDPLGTLKDTGIGLGAGGAFAAAGKGLGAATKYGSKKVSDWLLSLPEDMRKVMLERFSEARKSGTRFDLGKEMQADRDILQNKAFEGSKYAREGLGEELIPASRVREPYEKMSSGLGARMEGAPDPRREALKEWADSRAKSFSGEGYSPGRVKDEVQYLDSAIDWTKAGSGQAPTRIGSGDKKGVRSNLDAILKENPEYAKRMEPVANAQNLLSEGKPHLKNLKTVINNLKRVHTDKHGSGQVPREFYEKFGKEMGKDYLDKSKVSLANEMFEQAREGKTSVNLPFTPAVVNQGLSKMSGAIGAKALEYAAKAKETRQIGPLMALAKGGDKAAILALQIMFDKGDDK